MKIDLLDIVNIIRIIKNIPIDIISGKVSKSILINANKYGIVYVIISGDLFSIFVMVIMSPPLIFLKIIKSSKMLIETKVNNIAISIGCLKQYLLKSKFLTAIIRKSGENELINRNIAVMKRGFNSLLSPYSTNFDSLL